MKLERTLGEPVAPLIVDTRTAATLAQLQEVVDNVGRLRRFADPGDYDGFLLDRISGSLETLLNIYSPTAAELMIRDGKGVDEAIAAVDRRVNDLRRRLGAPQEEDR